MHLIGPLPILNKSGKPPEDGFFRVVATGTAPNVMPASGKKIVQVVDDEAITSMLNGVAAMVADGITEMLVDRDHKSHEGDTEAQAWLQLNTLARRQDGIFGKIEWTEDGNGKTLLNTKKFKFFSPEFDSRDIEWLDDVRIRPKTLVGLAVTNRANFPQLRFQNSTNPEPMNKLKELLAPLLNLAVDASDEAFAVAIKASKAAEAALKAEITTFRNSQIEASLDRFKNKLGTNEVLKKHARATLENNLADGVAFLEALPDPAPPAYGKAPYKQLHNSATAPNPKVDFTHGETETKPEDEAQAAKIKSRANELMNAQRAAGQNPNFSKAWSDARAEVLK